MPEGVDYASANVTAGTGLELNYIQDKCFAYSGAIGVPNVETTLIETQSGSGVIDAIIQCSYGTPDSDNMQYKIYFNGIIVMQFSMSGAVDVGNWQSMIYHFVIPPYTNIKVTGQNTTSSTGRVQTASLTGKVYK